MSNTKKLILRIFNFLITQMRKILKYLEFNTKPITTDYQKAISIRNCQSHFLNQKIVLKNSFQTALSLQSNG